MEGRDLIYMKSVLIDNRSLGKIIKFYIEGYEINYDENDGTAICNYLYALVLWDKIYSLEFNRSSRSAIKYIYGFDERQADFFRVEDIVYSKCSELEFLANDISQKYLIKNNEEYNKIAKDSIFYILLGYNLGLNTYLSKERSRFIKEIGLFENIFNREDIIHMVERDVLEFYKEINEKVGKKIITYESPLLLDYISQNCDDLEDAIQLAKYIREEKDVVQFRKAMDEMEEALNNGNFVLFNEYLSVIPDIVSSIKKSGIKTSSTTITISAVPSIAFPMEFENKKRNKKMIHMNFLIDLAMYGMYNRLSR